MSLWISVQSMRQATLCLMTSFKLGTSLKFEHGTLYYAWWLHLYHVGQVQAWIIPQFINWEKQTNFWKIIIDWPYWNSLRVHLKMTKKSTKINSFLWILITGGSVLPRNESINKKNSCSQQIWHRIIYWYDPFMITRFWLLRGFK